MNASDSSHEEDSEEAPVKAKRSKPDEAGGEEVVYHPVKLSRNDLYRPPTAEELNQLKEAESLFHCSLLKMQVRPRTLLTCTREREESSETWEGICLKSSPLSHVNRKFSLTHKHVVNACHLSPITDGGAAERSRLEWAQETANRFLHSDSHWAAPVCARFSRGWGL